MNVPSFEIFIYTRTGIRIEGRVIKETLPAAWKWQPWVTSICISSVLCGFSRKCISRLFFTRIIYVITFYVSGQNASILCRVKSVPKALIRWYEKRPSTSFSPREILNNSLINRGQQSFLIFQTHDGKADETSSQLVLTRVRVEDSGEFSCVAENPAGEIQANFSLQVCGRTRRFFRGWWIWLTAFLRLSHFRCILRTSVLRMISFIHSLGKRSQTIDTHKLCALYIQLFN